MAIYVPCFILFWEINLLIKSFKALFLVFQTILRNRGNPFVIFLALFLHVNQCDRNVTNEYVAPNAGRNMPLKRH